MCYDIFNEEKFELQTKGVIKNFQGLLSRDSAITQGHVWKLRPKKAGMERRLSG